MEAANMNAKDQFSPSEKEKKKKKEKRKIG